MKEGEDEGESDPRKEDGNSDSSTALTEARRVSGPRLISMEEIVALSFEVSFTDSNCVPMVADVEKERSRPGKEGVLGGTSEGIAVLLRELLEVIRREERSVKEIEGVTVNALKTKGELLAMEEIDALRLGVAEGVSEADGDPEGAG